MGPEHIYAHAFKRLYRYFYYKDMRPEDVEDLCQETFSVFFRKYDCSSLSEEECLKVLYRIASLAYKEWVRTAIKTASVELDEELDGASVATHFAAEEFEETVDLHREQLLQAIETLNPTLRDVIKLRFLENMTRKEIAERLGTKEKYVHIYQQRGIKALQKAVGTSAPVSLGTYTEQKATHE